MSQSLTVNGFPSSACMIKLLTTRPGMKISINSVFPIGIVYWPLRLRKRWKMIWKEQTFARRQVKFEILEYNSPTWLDVLEYGNILSLLIIIQSRQLINSIDSEFSVGWTALNNFWTTRVWRPMDWAFFKWPSKVSARLRLLRVVIA